MSLNFLPINNISAEEIKPGEGRWGEAVYMYEGATHVQAISVNTEEKPREHCNCNIFVCSSADAA